MMIRICAAVCGSFLAVGLANARADGVVTSLRTYLATPVATRGDWSAQAFANQPLTQTEAAEVGRLLLAEAAEQFKATRTAEWQNGAVVADGKTLKFVAKTIGTRPADGWDLYLSLHGGGNAPPSVNDGQWVNQQTLYAPPNSLYIAPRAPSDTWDLWHEPHVDTLIGRLIEDAVALGGANPDRVYLMGYSAGGDGVYQLAPRMADRFAAAAMMAGHPNDASPLGLRNLPFAIHVGALDHGYGRNTVAMKWEQQLDALQKDNPSGYVHFVRLHDGRGHWMNREDAEAVPWMAQYTRDATPAHVVWVQGRAIHDRFYWLANADKSVKPGATVEARRDGQTIDILRTQGVERLDVLLHDAMLDLDRPVRVRYGDRVLFDGIVPRTASVIRDGLQDRFDPKAVFSARLSVNLPKPPPAATRSMPSTAEPE